MQTLTRRWQSSGLLLSTYRVSPILYEYCRYFWTSIDRRIADSYFWIKISIKITDTIGQCVNLVFWIRRVAKVQMLWTNHGARLDVSSAAFTCDALQDSNALITLLDVLMGAPTSRVSDAIASCCGGYTIQCTIASISSCQPTREILIRWSWVATDCDFYTQVGN